MKTKKKQQCSLDEEMLMWTSYRYCIGRKSYVNTLAPYIGQKYYPILSEERREFTALDIRRSISDCLRLNTPSFEYEYSVCEKERNAVADYLTWLNENIKDSKDLANVKKITCYKDSYKKDAPKLIEVTTSSRSHRECYESDFSDLLIWEELASLFDKPRHKWITVNYNGKKECIECFEVWRKTYEPISEGLFKPVAWKYEKEWKSVKHYLERGQQAGCLNKKFITKIEDYDPTRKDRKVAVEHRV